MAFSNPGRRHKIKAMCTGSMQERASVQGRPELLETTERKGEAKETLPDLLDL